MLKCGRGIVNKKVILKWYYFYYSVALNIVPLLNTKNISMYGIEEALLGHTSDF